MTPPLRSLRALGQAHRGISALYLFGSQATGKAGPLSDLDVAVLLNEKQIRPGRFFSCRLDLMAEVMRACRQSDVDLVLLNETTPLLAYEVVRGGRLIYERDHDARVEFEARAVQHYLDLEPFYRVSRSYLKRQLLRAG
ncbi:MAG: nucleotidyltransferase domain-containing protein [Candidatus Omnitrophica bacterium]|nr:nucleotidyltransferase domain-containing protein [Candidatus Omnitrophota bacterium]